MPISARLASERLAGSGELALLDVREQGVHCRGHPFFACSAPLSRLELMIADLVPRKSAPLVLLDGGDEGLAEKALRKLNDLGYVDVSVLQGGCAGWKMLLNGLPTWSARSTLLPVWLLSPPANTGKGKPES